MGICHALNRGNRRASIFHKEGNYIASKRYSVNLWGRIESSNCATVDARHFHWDFGRLLSEIEALHEMGV